MVKYNENGELVVGLLDDTRVLSKSIIERYNYKEYKEKATEESRFVNACDKLEGMIHPLTIHAPIMNHEIFATYADKAIKEFPKLLPIYKEIKKILKTQYEKWGFEWKSDYDSIFKHCNNK